MSFRAILRKAASEPRWLALVGFLMPKQAGRYLFCAFASISEGAYLIHSFYRPFNTSYIHWFLLNLEKRKAYIYIYIYEEWSWGKRVDAAIHPPPRLFVGRFLISHVAAHLSWSNSLPVHSVVTTPQFHLAPLSPGGTGSPRIIRTATRKHICSPITSVTM